MISYGYNNLYPYKFTYYIGRGKNEKFFEMVRFYSNAAEANKAIPAMLDSEGISYKRLRISRMTPEEFAAYQIAP